MIQMPMPMLDREMKRPRHGIQMSPIADGCFGLRGPTDTDADFGVALKVAFLPVFQWMGHHMGITEMSILFVASK
jgi:hypothetical protein